MIYISWMESLENKYVGPFITISQDGRGLHDEWTAYQCQTKEGKFYRVTIPAKYHGFSCTAPLEPAKLALHCYERIEY